MAAYRAAEFFRQKDFLKALIRHAAAANRIKNVNLLMQNKCFLYFFFIDI